MALIEWDNSLSIGVSEIDRQHQQLVKMINELNDAMLSGKGREALRTIINGLISYTDTHFTTEERYFDQFDYSEADQHKGEHEAFVRKVSEFRDGYESGQIGLSISIMNFLSSWLTTHIKGSDKKYAPMFTANGVK